LKIYFDYDHDEQLETVLFFLNPVLIGYKVSDKPGTKKKAAVIEIQV
jgi:hypothetical protein